MPEPLKNLYNEQLVASLGRELKSVYKKFDSESFRQEIFDRHWNKKELKERMKHISVTLNDYLPRDYPAAIEILKTVSSRFNGFQYMFFPGYVELYGLDEFEHSVSTLEHFTRYSSSEFAVRPFICQYPDRMMGQMELWAESDNRHVRRLASEGCRPRLPWAMALPEFKRNPAPVLRVLEILKNDTSEYVRRSVANNLNDISKDNARVVIDVARKWLGDDPGMSRMVKHACRSLLKQGDPDILDLFGLFKPDHVSVEEFEIQDAVGTGDGLKFSFNLQTHKERLGRLRIEYAIDFMKKNGKQARKLFKISESDYSARNKTITREHSFRIISTRRYYAGTHGLAVIVNGHELKHGNFQLT